MLPRLEQASRTVARASRVLLDVLDTVDGDARLEVAGRWAALKAVAPRDVLAEAIDLVEELVPEDGGRPTRRCNRHWPLVTARCGRS